MVGARQHAAISRENDESGVRLSRRGLLGAAGIPFLVPAVSTAHAQEATPNATPVPDAVTGLAVAVFPTHGSRTASPATEISFRNTSAGALGGVRVTGSESGLHSGYLEAHTDQNGASFLVDAEFHPGETVTVRADIPLGAGQDGSVTFEVSRPAPASEPRVIDREEPAEAELIAYRSRPDLMVPRIETSVYSDSLAPGYVAVGARVSNGPAAAMLVDNDGEPVWIYVPDVDDYQILDVRVQEYLGRDVITWFEGASPRGYGYGHFVMYDRANQHVATFQVGNGFHGGDIHEFLLTPQGTALVLIYQPIAWDLSPAGGSVDGVAQDGIVQEIEPETGRVRFEWHSLDHVAIDETTRTPEDGMPFDYFHVNSAEKGSDGTYVVSARGTDAIYRIDGETGAVIWRLNGKLSDFAMGEGTPFRLQHDARVHPDGTLSLFDNATDNRESDLVSRGIVLALDEEAMTATLVREYLHPDDPVAVSQGNMQVLPNGNVLIGWGSVPLYSEFSAAGEVLLDGRMDAGVNSYRAYRNPWVGRPAAPPDIAVEASATGAMTVYASWNGATEVASWRVLAGPAPDDLTEIAETDRTGFETEIAIETVAVYCAVEALDGGGGTIGRSDLVQTGTATI